MAAAHVDGGSIAFFELAVCLGCLIIYLLMHYFSKKYASLTIQAEIYIWKLDVISSFGVAVAFFIQIIVNKTKFAWIAHYIDPGCCYCNGVFFAYRAGENDFFKSKKSGAFCS